MAMQRGLAVTNLSDPDPPAAWQWFFGSHPTTAQRIALAQRLGTAGRAADDAAPSSSPTTSRRGRAASRPSSRRCWPAARRTRWSCSPPTRPGSAAYDAALPYPGGPAADRRCCCRRRATAPGGRRARPAARLRQRLLRCGGAARAARPGAAGGGRRAPGRRHARARDRLGGAARRPAAAAAHRRRPRRPHLPQRVHPRPAGAGARPAAPGWSSSRPGSTSTGSPRTPTAPTSGERHGLRRRPGGRLRVPAGAAQGPGRADRGLAAGARAASRTRALLLVGGGPYGGALRRAVAARRASSGSVVLTGPVPPAELPGHYAAGDVFAMPCRTRRAGLDVEGLGIVYLEAAASGLPVVAGASGGAPDAVLDGVTGYVVEPRSAERGGRRDRRTCSTTRPAPARWARPAGPGSSSAGPGRRSPRPSATCSRSTEPRPAMRGGARGRSAGVERLDLVGELLHHDGALELQGRRQHPVVLGEVACRGCGTS